MKAVVYQKYGSPDVLELQEVDKPTITDGEVLVRVHAASANPLDWHFLRGTPLVVRALAGLLKPKHKILGADVAGSVEAVGENVTRFQPGDEVFAGYNRYVWAEDLWRRVSWAPYSVRRAAANALQGEADKCIGAGMDDYMSKPLEMPKLKQTLGK